MTRKDFTQELNEKVRVRLASEIGNLVIATIEAQSMRDIAVKKLEEANATPKDESDRQQ